MTFWQNLQATSGIGSYFYGVTIGIVATAVALVVFFPRERPRLNSALILFAFSFSGFLVATGMLYFDPNTQSKVYLLTRGSFQFLITIATINITSVLAFAAILPSVRMEPPKIAQDLIIALTYVAAAILLMNENGVNLQGIIATSAVLTAVIGFSMQESLGNAVGGMVLQTERMIREGDWIRVDDLTGKVKEIRWRYTCIETGPWDTVIIPNSMLMKGQVALLGRRAGKPFQQRQIISLSIDLRHPVSKVIKEIETALQSEPTPYVATEPQPHCLLTDFQDGYGIYIVRYWLTDFGYGDSTDSHMRTKILNALHRAGMSLFIPTHSILLTETNDSYHERKEAEELRRRVKVLKGVELFQPLTDDELTELARSLESRPFARGEALTRQGARADVLFIIIDGEANVEVNVEGKVQKVATLRAGNFFGEMALLTGEPRSASVIAGTDIHSYCLDKSGFESVLQKRPELVEQIAQILERRRSELDAIRAKGSEEASRERNRQPKGALLSRMKSFFKLGGAG